MNNFDLEKLFECPEYRISGESGEIQEVYYENEPYKGQPTEVFAYLGVPKSKKPVPGMVLIHGGGGKAFKEWVEIWMSRGYAAISMDLGGKGPDGEFLPKHGPDQTHEEKFGNDLAWEDIWTYHAICAVIRAHSLLLSLEGVNARRTGMTGISWGGYLTCCVAGLDDRFKVAVPVYGCGYLQDNSAVDWMNLFDKMTPERRQWWHDNCDPSVYLKNAEMPMMFVTGTNDFAYPLDSLRKSCLEPKGIVETCIRVEMPHGHEAGWNPIETFLYPDSILNYGYPMDSIHPKVLLRDGVATAGFSNSRPLKHYFLYTNDSGPWQERKWHQVEAECQDVKVRVEIPEGVTAFMLAIEDDRGAFTSTLPEILE